MVSSENKKIRFKAAIAKMILAISIYVPSSRSVEPPVLVRDRHS
jgi:hypothetical protein